MMICGDRCSVYSQSRVSVLMTSVLSGMSRGRLADAEVFFCRICRTILEGEGIGFGGVPANDRRFTNDQCVRALHISADLAQHMESLGDDILWLAEHHFQREGYECIPNILLLSLWLAQQTKQLRFGCAFNVLPMWHPLRLAEDYAMVDILTNGRVIFGMGRGYHTREVETFGAPMLQGGDAGV